MAVTKQKVKTSPKVSEQVVVEELGSEMIYLEKQIAKLQDKIAPLAQRQSEIKKALLEYANETLGEDETLEVAVEGKTLYIGKRGTSRTVTDLEQAIEFMGINTFMKVAKITMADIDAYLRPEEIEQCVSTTRTDTRQIKLK